MRANKYKVRLPIGRTARLTVQMDAMRLECCEAAEILMRQKSPDEAELDECARLDDALAEAQRLLKFTITRITMARLKRRIQAK